ncbi:MAG: hypothetical protein NC301_02785 [Bacteroides sp.]|nr:hypothetical protein [Bacteroides sp.]MCM1379658.1 hypothetical protein [Bacteroides sp.]MCM1445960.1 hypothetical protein [Prevotella sp.]
MNKPLLLLLSAIVLILAGCKSKQEAAPVVEETKWQNMTVPVKLTISQPMNLTINGTLTMVRGQYAYVTFRTFGFEVAQANVTPEQMDMVLKMPSKMWVNEPLGDRLKSRSLDFTALQDAIAEDKVGDFGLGGASVVSRSDGEKTFAVSTNVKGVNISVALSYNLNDAKWNSTNPASFSNPDSGYSKISLESAAKLLGK